MSTVDVTIDLFVWLLCLL